MKSLRLLLVIVVVAAGPLACTVDARPDPSEDDGDPGDEDAVGDTAEALRTRCSITRGEILASVTGARRTAIERGFAWWDAQVPYSQARTYHGYRTDCSGFVSMAWQLGTSYTTAEFASGAAPSHAIGSYASLVPGDALVRRRNGSGHITLFLGWNDAGHRSACVLEEANTALDMELGTRSASSLSAGGYRAIRADELD